MADERGAIRQAAEEITSRIVGYNVGPEVGAIDPAIFELINLIAEWIIKIIQALRERFTPEQSIYWMRNPRWLWQRRITAQIDDEVPRRFKRQSKRISQEMFTAGAQYEESRLRSGIAELELDFV